MTSRAATVPQGRSRTHKTRIFALTGTPGVGKSTVGREILARRPDLQVVEVADLVGGTRRSGGRRRPRGSVEVDLDVASRRIREMLRSPTASYVVVVGHLSHLLPIPNVILLRCRPSVLAERLRGRGVDPRWVQENQGAERLDTILVEAVRLGRRIWERDTTGRTPGSIAAWVLRVLDGTEPPRRGTVDWLSLEPPAVPDVPPRRSSSRPRPSERHKRTRSSG